MSGKYRNYTPQDDAYIAANYYKVPTAEMAAHLGRTVNSVRMRASDTGVAKKRGHNVKTGAAGPVAGYDPDVVVAGIMDEMIERNRWPEVETPMLDKIMADRVPHNGPPEEKAAGEAEAEAGKTEARAEETAEGARH